MRDLNINKTKPAGRNRLKKQRKPINYRAFFKKAMRVIGGMLAVALVGLTGYEIYSILGRTTLLKLEKIEVNELKRLSREEVVGLAGVKPGDDMLSLRLRQIGEQLGKNPWVGKVSIRRHFPHTLTIEVAEREPVAVVNIGYLYYLDKNGEIFKPLNEGDRLDYPVITGITDEEMGRDPAGFRESLKKSRDLIALLSAGKAFRLDDISEIHYDKGYGFTLFTAQGGVPVKLGNSAFEEKLGRLAKVYQDLKGQMPGLVYIDIDFSDKIIVKKV